MKTCGHTIRGGTCPLLLCPPISLPSPTTRLTQLKKAIFLSDAANCLWAHLYESTSQNPNPETPVFGHSLLNGLFLQNRSDPILVTCSLKTIRLSCRSPKDVSPEGTIFLSFPNRAAASSPGKPHHLGAEPEAECVRKLVKEPRVRLSQLRAESSFLGLFDGQTVRSPRWEHLRKRSLRAMCN